LKAAFLIGRVLFGGFFLYNGINHLKQREMLSQYAGSKHVPLPELAVTTTGAAMITGGISILLGIKPQAAQPPLSVFWPECRRSCTTSGELKIRTSA
jgi:putative oxidoreductase